MSIDTTQSFKAALPTEWLACYLQTEEHKDSQSKTSQNTPIQLNYQLPLGQLKVLQSKVYWSKSDNKTIEEACRSAIKFSLSWKKHHLKKQRDTTAENDTLYITVLDIQESSNNNGSSSDLDSNRSLAYHFGTAYFVDNLAIDADITESVLQVFDLQDWQTILTTLQTPNECWQFLENHREILRQSAVSDPISFDSVAKALKEFISSPSLFSNALSIDNALIRYGIQNEPNTTLVTMSLAQKNQSTTMNMYHAQMQQAAILWTQLCKQMLEIAGSKLATNKALNNAVTDEHQGLSALQKWQQQLLEESLFSRFELVNTLYQHSKRPIELKQSGYVVHQHSYESLGQHYVMIFYGQGADSKQSRATIVPNLEQIAQDTAMRLPIEELHHIIMLGITFIVEGAETYLDIDLLIQPVVSMSQKERQLTHQLQKLKHDTDEQRQLTNKVKDSDSLNESAKLPSLKLNINIPSHKKNS